MRDIKKKDFTNLIYGLSPLIIGIVVAILIIGGMYLAMHTLVNFEFDKKVNSISNKLDKEFNNTYNVDFNDECKAIKGKKKTNMFYQEYFIIFETSKENLENNFLGEKWNLSEGYDEVNEIKYQDETYEMEKPFYKFSDESFSGKLYYKETENGLLCIFVGSKAFLQLT